MESSTEGFTAKVSLTSPLTSDVSTEDQSTRSGSTVSRTTSGFTSEVTSTSPITSNVPTEAPSTKSESTESTESQTTAGFTSEIASTAPLKTDMSSGFSSTRKASTRTASTDKSTSHAISDVSTEAPSSESESTESPTTAGFTSEVISTQATTGFTFGATSSRTASTDKSTSQELSTIPLTIDVSTEAPRTKSESTESQTTAGFTSEMTSTAPPASSVSEMPVSTGKASSNAPTTFELTSGVKSTTPITAGVSTEASSTRAQSTKSKTTDEFTAGGTSHVLVTTRLTSLDSSTRVETPNAQTTERSTSSPTVPSTTLQSTKVQSTDSFTVEVTSTAAITTIVTTGETSTVVSSPAGFTSDITSSIVPTVSTVGGFTPSNPEFSTVSSAVFSTSSPFTTTSLTTSEESLTDETKTTGGASTQTVMPSTEISNISASVSVQSTSATTQDGSTSRMQSMSSASSTKTEGISSTNEPNTEKASTTYSQVSTNEASTLEGTSLVLSTIDQGTTLTKTTVTSSTLSTEVSTEDITVESTTLHATTGKALTSFLPTSGVSVETSTDAGSTQKQTNKITPTAEYESTMTVTTINPVSNQSVTTSSMPTTEGPMSPTEIQTMESPFETTVTTSKTTEEKAQSTTKTLTTKIESSSSGTASTRQGTTLFMPTTEEAGSTEQTITFISPEDTTVQASTLDITSEKVTVPSMLTSDTMIVSTESISSAQTTTISATSDATSASRSTSLTSATEEVTTKETTISDQATTLSTPTTNVVFVSTEESVTSRKFSTEELVTTGQTTTTKEESTIQSTTDTSTADQRTSSSLSTAVTTDSGTTSTEATTPSSTQMASTDVTTEKDGVTSAKSLTIESTVGATTGNVTTPSASTIPVTRDVTTKVSTAAVTTGNVTTPSASTILPGTVNVTSEVSTSVTVEASTVLSTTIGEATTVTPTMPSLSTRDSVVTTDEMTTPPPSTFSGVTAHAYGDPHFLTFDTRSYNFQGECEYLLASDCLADSSRFRVVINNDKSTNFPDYAQVVGVDVTVDDILISMVGSSVSVDGISVILPVQPATGLTIRNAGSAIAISSDFGLNVEWGLTSSLSIILNSTFENVMCGLAGDYNGNPDDDTRTATGTVASLMQFTNSFVENPEDCPAYVPPPDDPCATQNASVVAGASSVCDMLVNLAGPFGECIRRVSSISTFYQSCLYDFCATYPNGEGICDVFATAARECRIRGYVVDGWRSADLCSVECGANSTYSYCGPACPTTCYSVRNQGDALQCSDASCVEGCFCDAGSVLEGNQCVPPEACGCVSNGFYHVVGETWLTSGCVEECTCYSNGTTICQALSCSEYSTCEIRNGAQGCYCREGYEGDGINCLLQCQEDYFRCPEGTCIPELYVCDEYPGDCLNNYDDSEELCCNIRNVTAFCPKPNYFRCPDGVYIPFAYVCDDWPYDCLDNYDESPELCTGVCPNPGIPSQGSISPFQTIYTNGSTVEYTCNDGYVLIGETSDTCIDGAFSSVLPQCLASCILPREPNNGALNSTAFNHSDVIGFTCNDGYQMTPEGAFVRCDNGAVMGNIPICTDINECSSLPCQNNGTCFNEINQYRCECSQGWTGANCEQDINECSSSSLNDCGLNATCTNTNGSYICTCDEGFMGDGITCIEIILFPFSTSNGDSQLSLTSESATSDGGRNPTLEEISPTIRPPTGFPFGDTFYYSLYFMDNGLIIFINENDEKYGFPNPYPDGFSNDTLLPLVAPFWADADISDGEGEVFYQVYERSYTNTANQSAVLDNASYRIRAFEPDMSGFNATWMLVVTWTNLPSFISTNTNTFQAALVTDSRYSFVLFNYQENDMNWDPVTLASTNVIMGYNLGNGQYVNMHLIDPPFAGVDERFRPDQYVGNTGLKGRWIYRLENNTVDTINAKQFCLDWYNSEPAPNTWDRYLGTCPCSFTQGGEDGAYSSGRRSRGSSTSSSSRALDQALIEEINTLDGEPFCLQTSISPLGNGAGMYCCYRGDQSLIEGYGGDLTSSFEERYQFNLGGSFDFVAYLNWLLYDFSPRHYCCGASNDEAFCDLYTEKRPAGTCTGYLPPNSGWMLGDPHITTLDGYIYTFNGLGEYTLVTIPDTAGTSSLFTLQGRTMRALDTETQELTDATFFVAFAAQATNSTLVEMELNDMGTDFNVYVDGVFFNKSSLSQGTYVNGDFSLQERMSNGSLRVVAYWQVGMSINVGVIEGILDIVFSAPESYKTGVTRGLFGVWDGDVSNDFMKSDAVLQDATGSDGNYTDSDLFTFGESWRISASESLFNYTRTGQSWVTFNDVTFTPVFLDDLITATEQSDPTFLATAQDTCGSSKECLYDTLATKDNAIGLSTKQTEETFITNNDILLNFPPNVTGVSNNLRVEVGNPVNFTVMATDPEGSDVTFDLLNEVPGAEISSSSGVFMWTPQSTEPVSLVIRASDGQVYSPVEPVVKVCDCQNNGTCMYDQYTDDSNIINDKFAVVVCECSPGWTGDFCQLDYDACTDNPCFPGVTCIDRLAPSTGNLCGSGTCPDGLVGDGFKCADFDECVEWANRSSADGGPACEQICINVLGSYYCSCDPGYELHPDLRTCIDIDECELETDNCNVNADCVNTVGSFSCSCLDGYRGDGISCTDIDECQELTQICDPNADCTNIPGSYVCECVAGFEGNGQTCTDIDECSRNLDNCNINAVCTNTVGSYGCACEAGWEGDGITSCTNINECQLASRECHPRATCEDTLGSYLCTCPAGLVGDGITCVDIDECTTGLDECAEGSSLCLNTQGSYDCRCNSGYSGDGFTCNDVNECRSNVSVCSVNALCDNTVGSFSCQCKSGFAGDGVTCVDINECAIGTDDCNSTLGICTNTVGSYSCACISGYTGDGRTCQDIDECLTQADDCEQVCTNTVGSFECSCTDGYRIDPTLPNTCLDEDECALGISGCPQGCNNTTPAQNPDGFVCYCYEGFIADQEGNCIPETSCISTVCSNADCLNLNGMEMCVCYNGYKFNGSDITSCIDIDECTDVEYTNMCNQNCTNIIGSYNCSCLEGYSLESDGRTCSDINECLDGTSTCDVESQICINTVGDFMCQCRTGFVQNGSICQDINECADTSVCGSNAVCINSLGSYMCSCVSGYDGDGITCLDVDECSSENDCHEFAECVNTEGSYNCSCLSGYSGNGTFCANIDECLNDTTCVSPAFCVDTSGSFICDCPTGYDPTGTSCININECTLSQNDTRRHECDSNAACVDLPGSYNCSCLSGYQGNGFQCEDVNECNTPDACATNSQCTNTEGSYLCTCDAGYRGDARIQCNDINECDENPNICDENASCNNTVGSYTCICNNGFTSNGTACTNVDECVEDALNDCHPLATCTDTLGSYICTCQSGFISPEGARGRLCNDLDECSLGISTCDAVTEDCFNTYGAFTCSCADGYGLSDGQCQDVDECLDEPCESQVNTRCENLAGSYQCVCRTGYYVVNSECLPAMSMLLTATFTDIAGLEVLGQYFLYDDFSSYIPQLETDVDNLFQSSDLTNYTAVSVSTSRLRTLGVEVEFILDFLATSTTTGDEILAAFLAGLRGRDNNVVLLSNVIIRSSAFVGEPVIDPCVEQTDNCTTNADCIFLGTSGNYTCQCQDGFMGDGFTNCTDINECLNDTCTDEGEICVNTAGSYSCDCMIDRGYIAKDGICTLYEVYLGQLTITSVSGQAAIFTSDLTDSSSQAYSSLAFLVSNAVRYLLLLEPNLQDFFESCTVSGFTNGSVVATYYVSFNQSVNTSESALTALLVNTLETDGVLTTGIASQGNITADSNSVEFTKITKECTDSFCLNGGICSLQNGLRVCQCPGGYEGDICQIAPSTRPPVMTTTLEDTTMATENITQITNTTTSSTETTGLTDAQIIGIVFGVLGVIFVVFLFIVCFCAAVIRYRRRNMMLYSKPRTNDRAEDRLHVLYNVPYAQRTGRSNFRVEDSSDAFRLPSYLVDSEFDFSERTSDIFRSTDSYSDESYSFRNLSYNTEEDRRMQQLAEVITQSPYLNERMRSQITDIAGRSPFRGPPRSEFVRPYLATGREAEFLSASSQSGDSIRPTRRFQIPRAQVPWGLQESHT